MMNLLSSITCIRLIAANTFLEAVRQKFFNALLLISISLVASSTFFQQFDFGTGELKFITDFGFGALFFFGSILSIAATTQLFFSEIENRTALTILAKPIYKIEFLIGKFLGTSVLMLIFTTVIMLILAGILYWRETELMARLSGAFAKGRLVRYDDLIIFGLLQWIKFNILSAITLFIASFSNTSLYTIVVSFFMLIICQLQYIARDAYTSIENLFVQWLVWFLSLIFPNFQLFNVGDQLVLSPEKLLSQDIVLMIAGYGIVYTVVFISLAQINFNRREI